MNFRFHDIAYSINCDWLQYSVRAKTANPELLVPDGYRLEVTQGNTKLLACEKLQSAAYPKANSESCTKVLSLGVIFYKSRYY